MAASMFEIACGSAGYGGLILPFRLNGNGGHCGQDSELLHGTICGVETTPEGADAACRPDAGDDVVTADQFGRS